MIFRILFLPLKALSDIAAAAIMFEGYSVSFEDCRRKSLCLSQIGTSLIQMCYVNTICYSLKYRMLEHALSAVFDVSHGAGLACLTPYYLSFISKEDTAGKIDRLGVELFGIDSSDKNINGETVNSFSKAEHRGFRWRLYST